MGEKVLMSVLAQHETESGQDIYKGSLMPFRRRLEQLSYDKIIKMAEDPASGIQLTDKLRVNFLACAQGKQKKPVVAKGY